MIRREKLGIAEPVVQWINYNGNIECNKDPSLPYLDNEVQDTLRCNVLWNEDNYKRLEEHLRDYYATSNTREASAKVDCYLSELQIAKFMSLLQEEKVWKQYSVF